MAMVYAPSTYNDLPTLSNAGMAFEEKNGEDLITNQFRALFLQYNMERIFGLILLHRHFELSEEERLVE